MLKQTLPLLAILGLIHNASATTCGYPIEGSYTCVGTSEFLTTTLISPWTTTKSSLDRANNDQKLVIKNAAPDAMAVIDGEGASDLFLAARAAAEEILEIQFANDVHAAATIIELSEAL